MTPMTRCFVKDLERFAQQHEIVQAQRTQRTKEYLSQWQGGEGILYIGKAQERARVLRTERRSCHGCPVPLVNEQYGDGESYLHFRRKFRSTIPEVLFLLPMPSSVGHDYLKMQLTKRGIAALDNGILRCDDHEVMNAIAQEITPACALLRKWLARLPHPFTSQDRIHGVRISVLQAE